MADQARVSYLHRHRVNAALQQPHWLARSATQAAASAQRGEGVAHPADAITQRESIEDDGGQPRMS
ncbi:hypothetical protein ACN9MZ_28155 [Pseudoduganella sp. S-14]|uniref:hypothetical protein n=1 Tax=Pseudoduganella sp. S-14 TaxID=3404065 RepID=UPI003CE71C65